jgi:hypothetical protein
MKKYIIHGIKFMNNRQKKHNTTDKKNYNEWMNEYMNIIYTKLVLRTVVFVLFAEFIRNPDNVIAILVP